MIAVVVSVARNDVDAVTDLLWSLGVLAVEERELDNGDVELWTSLGDPPEQRALDALGDPDDPALRRKWRLEHVDDSVVDTWRDHAEPTVVDTRLAVCPAWVEAPDGLDPDAIVLAIDPGSTFGMGDHPTTRLSLAALRRAVERRTGRPRVGSVARRPVRVLDVGCGSGVLAIAAVRLGADLAVGTDIAPVAVAVTVANAERNGVAEAVEASTESVDAIVARHGRFDVVVANILAPVLVELAPDIVDATAPGGTVVLSGMLRERHRHVIDAFVALGVTPTGPVDECDGWVAVTLERPAEAQTVG